MPTRSERPRRVAFFVVLILALYAPFASAQPLVYSFHVATSGSDENDGSREKPFATIHRARDAVREKIAAGMTNSARVLIHEGTYFFDTPLVFGLEDSGTEFQTITYQPAPGGRRPVLSGGRPITGFKEGSDGVWTVELPRVKAGEWHFRQLFVDGRRAVRARTPNKNAEEYCWRLQDAHIAEDLQTHTLTLGPGRLEPWSRLADAEAIVLKNWATLHKRIERVDPATGLVVLQRPHVEYFGGNRPRKGGGCFFENAPEMLDQPGEWYLDRKSGVLRYWPLPGQEISRVEVIAPVLGCVIEIAGKLNEPVRNLHFRGLDVMHSHVPLPDEGHHGRQAAFRYGESGTGGGLPSAIRWSHADRCVFIGGEIAHVGGGGIALREGCVGNTIEGNAVFDTAGNGINVGGPNDEDLVPIDNRIANNYVHHCGAVYYGACAIWAGFAQNTIIEHNRVCEHPYTGISIGWQWDSTPTAARRYIVRYNHVYNVLKEVCDGGAIYSLGYQPRTHLLANHLHDVQRSKYATAAPNNGIFLDEGSKGFLIEDNVIYRTAGRPVRHNRNEPEGHTWKNNVLLEGDLPEDATEQLKRVQRAGLQFVWRGRLLKDL